MNTQDQALRELAVRYVNLLGAKAAAEEVPRVDAAADAALRRKIQGKMPRKNGRRIISMVASLAACAAILAVALIGPWSILYERSGTTSDPGAVGEALGETAGTTDAAAPGEGESTSPALSRDPLPLPFDLPPEYSVAGIEQDLDKTVYTLQGNSQDPVVLVMEPESGFSAEEEGFSPVLVAGGEVWVKSTTEYHLLTYEQEGIRFTYSCRYDLDTLLALVLELFNS